MNRFVRLSLALLPALGTASCGSDSGANDYGISGAGNSSSSGGTGLGSGGASVLAGQAGTSTIAGTGGTSGIDGTGGIGGTSGPSGTAGNGATSTGGSWVITIPRGRPHLNAARTTFVADNDQPLRGPYTSSEWGDPAPYERIAEMKTLGFNALHLYAECFDINYPKSGSTAPGYSASRIDSVVAAARELGLYLVMTIGNGANNGNNNLEYALDFWKFYSQRYADEPHVLFEIHNEPVAWGPSYVTATSPAGAMNLEIESYKTIRQYAPDSPVLLFSYSVLGDSAGSQAALTDIHAFNEAIFGSADATWDNLAVAFHGYAGADGTAKAVQGILAAGYPALMTEFGGGIWGKTGGGADVELTAALERLGVSWLAFAYVPPWGVSDNVALPEVFKNRVDNSGLSWAPDFGNWPQQRGVHGNGGLPWEAPGYVNNRLSGTLRIETENFDDGGKGVAYFNANATNPGGAYRTNETVAIESTTDAGGGNFVGSTAAGDWLEYTARVPAAGVFELRLRVASASSARVQVLQGGTNLTGEWDLPATGGTQAWTTVTKNVLVAAGQQKFRLNVLVGGVNLNWIELSPVTNGALADGTYTIQNVGNGQSLNVDGNKTVVTSDSAAQWTLEHLGGSEYKVALAGGDAWTTFMGPLHLGPWWGASGDRAFVITRASGGNYSIMPAGSGLAFQPSTDSPPQLTTQVWTDSPAQQWTIH